MLPRAIIGHLIRHRGSNANLLFVNKAVYYCKGSLDNFAVRSHRPTFSWLRHFSSARILATSEPSPSWDGPLEPESESARSKRYRYSSHIMSYIRNLHWNFTYDPDNQVVNMEHPGLSYESVDSNGNPKLWSLLNLLVSGRFYAYHSKITPNGDSYLEYDKMTADHYTFMVACELKIDKAMYEASVPKNPLSYKLELGYVGNSSLSTVATVQDMSLQHTLLSNVNQVVCVDKQTRRPISLPAWWKEKYAGAATRRHQLRFEVQSPPASPAPPEYNLTVAWSDTDMYQHTNFASYVRYSIDALHDAVGKPGINLLTEDKIREGIEYVGMTYLGESVRGDVLTVRVWETLDGKTPLYLCDIHKQADPNKKTIFQCSLKFYAKVV